MLNAALKTGGKRETEDLSSGSYTAETYSPVKSTTGAWQTEEKPGKGS
jgi:hypothetical protein